MWQLGILVLAISVGLFWRKNCFCVFWPFLVFLGVIFTQPRCFRVFLALHMTSTHPRHLPDTLRYHPDTARHPQTPSRHPSDTPIFGLHEATGRKSNIWIPSYLFNWSQFIWHLPTPDICLTHSDTIQTPPYLACMRPLGERVISEYHDIYSTVFNFSDNCFTQTSVRHAQTLSRNCQTPSTPSRHPSNAPILL